MRNLIVLLACVALLMGACAIPGVGPYASEDVDRFMNTRFTTPGNPKRTATGSLYSNVAQGQTWLYRTEREGAGTRYFILYYYERCKYSLYVDENDIIRSWRDEGGRDHMKSCLLH
jgi:hypothetical protein